MCLARHCANDLLMTARNFDEQVLNEFIRVAQNRLKNNKNLLHDSYMTIAAVISIVY